MSTKGHDKNFLKAKFIIVQSPPKTHDKKNHNYVQLLTLHYVHIYKNEEKSIT